MQVRSWVKVSGGLRHLSTRPLRFLFAVLLGWIFCQTPALAQRTRYAGVLGGVCTLSGDAASQLTPQGLKASLYKPENGLILNLLGGVQFHQYLSLQFNYVWNRNSLAMSSTSGGSSFYVQLRSSSQQSATADLLVYFRRRESRLRPYLGVGTGLAHLTSTQIRTTALGGTPVLPPTHFSSTQVALHVPVGIDFAITPHVLLRYSFSETLRHNDVSDKLSPPGERLLASFHNLAGILVRF